METNKRNIQEADVMKQLMELLEQQNMREQSQDFTEIFQFVAGMQIQLSVMVEELQTVRKQLDDLQDNQPKSVKDSLTEKITQLEGKANSLMEKLAEVKDQILQTAVQAVNAFKERGKQEMNQVLHQGIVGVQKLLGGCREKMTEVLVDAEKTANQIDSIGDELKQIGNSAANVGRLISGKGTKEVSEEKPGVALTRLLNAPVKKRIAILKKGIGKLDHMVQKLEQTSARLEPKKETDKSRVSVKKKLSELKGKSGQQKKQPDKSRQQESCL